MIWCGLSDPNVWSSPTHRCSGPVRGQIRTQHYYHIVPYIIHHTLYILTARRGTQWAEYPVHCCGSTTRSIMSAGAGRRGWAGYPTTLQVIRLWCNDAAVFTKLINLHKTVLCKLIPILRVGWFHAVLLTAFAVLHWWMVSSATAASQHSGQQAAFRHHLVAF